MPVTPHLLDAPAAAEQTLGRLLYGDPGMRRISEAAWAALVSAIAAQDARALRAFWHRLHRLVFTLAVRITADRANAEEVTLDVFHEVWRRAGAYDPNQGTVIGWVMNLARSRAIDRVRHDTRRKRTATHVASDDVTQSQERDPVERREDAARVRAALRDLTRGERDAIELAYFSDVSYAQVAQRLAEPLGTIKTRIRSGLAKLRFALDREGDR